MVKNKKEIIKESVKDSRMDLSIKTSLDALVIFGYQINKIAKEIQKEGITKEGDKSNVNALNLQFNNLVKEMNKFNNRAKIYLESKTDFKSYLEQIK